MLLVGCAQQDAQAALGQVVKAAGDAVSGVAVAPAPAVAATRAAPAGGSPEPIIREAIQLCMQSSFDAASARKAFTDAGWVYEPEDFAGEIIDWYSKPGQGLNVMVIPEPPRNGECRINVDGVGVTEALSLTASALESLHPGVFEFGEMERSARVVTPRNPGRDRAACTGWTGWFGQRPTSVGVTSGGNDPACVEDGTSQIVVNS
jgi:hypothetical protein